MRKHLKLFTSILMVSVIIAFYGCHESKGKINVFIVGDSTVKNGRDDGATGLWGWGNPIKYYFDSTKVHVENHALGGTSSRSFRDQNLWYPVVNNIKPGDYVLIQFGHNDGGSYNTDRARASIKGIGDDSIRVYMEHKRAFEYVHTYGWYLRQYINETKAKGGIPIIITSIPRNDWDGDKIMQSDSSYPLWAKQVAMAENVQYIDLNKKMTTELEKFSQKEVTGTYFFARDHTHTTAKGALLNAGLVAHGILELENCPLAQTIIENPEFTFPEKIRVILIGDSTVAKGNDGIQGWGEDLQKYFDDDRVEVINRARGGRSTRSFNFEGLWDEALALLRPGDYLLIQFGHNDGSDIDKGKYRGSIKGTGADTMLVKRDSIEEVVHTFGWYLNKYTTGAQAIGATPIILSPIAQNEWDGSNVKRTFTNYQEWDKEIAYKAGTYYIDINEIIAKKYEELGPKYVDKEFFLNDHTHTTPAGADLNAQSVIEGIKKSGSKLGNYLSYEE